MPRFRNAIPVMRLSVVLVGEELYHTSNSSCFLKENNLSIIYGHNSNRQLTTWLQLHRKLWRWLMTNTLICMMYR